MAEAHKKIEPGFCYFGEEKLQVEYFKDLFKEKILFTSIKTFSNTSTGFKAPPALSIEVLVNPDKSVKEARINDRVNGITAKYDGSGKLVMDEWLLKHLEATETARGYEQRLQAMLEYASSIQKHQMLQFKKQLLLPSTIKTKITAEAREKEAEKASSSIEKERGKFYEYIMGKEIPTEKISNRWTIYISKKVVYLMGLERNMSCRLQREGNSIVMSVLGYTKIPEKIHSNIKDEHYSLVVPIPKNMLFIAGLKLGDYTVLRRDGDSFSLREADKDTPGARKIIDIGSENVGISIPRNMLKGEGIEKGRYILFSFGNDENGKLRVWFEVGGKTRDVSKLSQLGQREEFVIGIPESVREGFSRGDELTMEVKEGKLYMRKKQ
jgi:hypothetical protein